MITHVQRRFSFFSFDASTLQSSALFIVCHFFTGGLSCVSFVLGGSDYFGNVGCMFMCLKVPLGVRCKKNMKELKIISRKIMNLSHYQCVKIGCFMKGVFLKRSRSIGVEDWGTLKCILLCCYFLSSDKNVLAAGDNGSGLFQVPGSFGNLMEVTGGSPVYNLGSCSWSDPLKPVCVWDPGPRGPSWSREVLPWHLTSALCLCCPFSHRGSTWYLKSLLP